MSQIIASLNHKVLFITGATGFLAKGLVEKILRHAPNIKRIYLLVRPKNTAVAPETGAALRLERDLLQSNVFTRLKAELGHRFDPLVDDKLVAIPGDLTQPAMGVALETYRRLTREVDIVINSAATVRFDDPLDAALALNALGPQRVLEFAQACRDAVLVHVSTAYVNGHLQGEVGDQPPCFEHTLAEWAQRHQKQPYDLASEIEAIQTWSRDIETASHRPERLAAFERELKQSRRGQSLSPHRQAQLLELLRQRWQRQALVDLGTKRARELGWLDSYTFTKAMGEQLIVNARGQLPTAIVRPSIIESSLAEPEPGWLDGMKVSDTLITYYGKGRLPDFPGHANAILDIVPVDIVINAILALLPTLRHTRDCQIVQVATGAENPISLRQFVDLCADYFACHPLTDRDGNPLRLKRWTLPNQATFERRWFYYRQLPTQTLLQILNWLPAIKGFKLKRHLSNLNTTLTQARSLSRLYSPYTHMTCTFRPDRLRRLHEQMSAIDRDLFNCDVLRIDWPTYVLKIHIPGLQRNVLNLNSQTSLSTAR